MLPRSRRARRRFAVDCPRAPAPRLGRDLHLVEAECRANLDAVRVPYKTPEDEIVRRRLDRSGRRNTAAGYGRDCSQTYEKGGADPGNVLSVRQSYNQHYGVVAKQGQDREVARALLAESYLAATQPSFHLIPRGQAMTPEAEFVSAYAVLAEETSDFTDVSLSTLSAALDREPATLAPLRMILGFTTNELAVAIRLLDPSQGVTGGKLKNFERRARPPGAAATGALSAFSGLLAPRGVSPAVRNVQEPRRAMRIGSTQNRET